VFESLLLPGKLLLGASIDKGRYKYLAPELKVLYETLDKKKKREIDKVNYHKADVFSFGVTLLELSTFADMSSLVVVDDEKAVIKTDYKNELLLVCSKNYGNEIADIIDRMLEMSAEHRPDFRQLRERVKPSGSQVIFLVVMVVIESELSVGSVGEEGEREKHLSSSELLEYGRCLERIS
jgi:serine/threonine protein kinase